MTNALGSFAVRSAYLLIGAKWLGLWSCMGIHSTLISCDSIDLLVSRMHQKRAKTVKALRFQSISRLGPKARMISNVTTVSAANCTNGTTPTPSPGTSGIREL